MNGWGLSEGRYGYLAGTGAASFHSFIRRFLHWSFSREYERSSGGSG